MRILRLPSLAALAVAALACPVAPAQPTERPLADPPPRERPLVDKTAPPPRPDKDKAKEPPAGAPALDPKLLPADDAALAEVDNAFKRWSATWMFDRYLPGSVRATERGLTGETYMLRGTFDFARGGQRITIPFAAAYARSAERFALAKLCYNDVSSGMTDCVDPGQGLAARQAAAAQSQQLMGAIVLLGLAAAMSDSQETCVKRYNFFGQPYFECE